MIDWTSPNQDITWTLESDPMQEFRIPLQEFLALAVTHATENRFRAALWNAGEIREIQKPIAKGAVA